MRLLFVHERLGSLGGAEANVLITATELRARGHTVGLAAQSETGKNSAAWKKVFSEGVFVQGPQAILTALEMFRPDAVYIHKWEDLPTLRHLLETGLPLIRMVHDHDTYCLRSYRYNVFTRRVCRRPATAYCIVPCLAPIKRNREGGFPLKWAGYFDKLEEIRINRRFNRHLVVTRYMRDELLLNGFAAERIEIFPPVPRPGREIRSSFSNRNLILFAGQIIRGKGVDVLLRALAKVRSPFEAVILGDGNQRRSCEKLARRLGLSGRVHFKGFIPQEELVAYYEDTSVVVVPSVWPEPIATIGLEVMRYALPVVAFDAGGIGDWLRDGVNGYLVPWMDTDHFANRLDALLSDKTMAREMGARGLEIVSREYDFEAYISRLEDLFDRMVKSATPALPAA
jgi:glycosyltransferase involved in cell wall biosynthesis